MGRFQNAEVVKSPVTAANKIKTNSKTATAQQLS